jgi:hypothetical protein
LKAPRYYPDANSGRRIDMDELIRNFASSIAAAKSEPKGVKIGLELWKVLKSAGLIEMRSVAAWGLFDLGFEMPFYKSTCLIYDPELDITRRSFQLPDAVL